MARGVKEDLTWAALVLPALGLVSVAAAMLAHGVRFCWPLWGAHLGGCALILGAGFLCWLLPSAALAAAACQWVKTHRALAPLLRRRIRPDRRLDALARTTGLEGAVVLVPDLRLWAFTYGLWRPRVALSSGLCHHLADQELCAVLLHEAYHHRRRAPLRLFLARSARAVLGFLPPAGRLLYAYQAASELAADAHALDRLGPRPLAAALWKLRTSPAISAVPFAPEGGLLRARVAQMEGYPRPLPAPGLRWADVLSTAAGVVSFTAWALLCLRT